MFKVNTFYWTDDEGNLVIETNVAGKDPKDLKVTFSDGWLTLNGQPLLRPGTKFDFEATKTEYNFGLLTTKIPLKKPVVKEIPIAVLGA